VSTFSDAQQGSLLPAVCCMHATSPAVPAAVAVGQYLQASMHAINQCMASEHVPVSLLVTNQKQLSLLKHLFLLSRAACSSQMCCFTCCCAAWEQRLVLV
jgi:hypothetical protein